MHVEECTKIEKDENGTITYPSEDGPRVLQPNTLVSMNMWGFKPNYFTYAEKQLSNFIIEKGHELKSEFYIPSMVDKLIHDGELKVNVLKTTSSWFGVTYPEDKAAVQEQLKALIDSGAYPQNIWE